MQVPRTRGLISGLVLIVLGIWGAIIPFVGPYFNYGFTPDSGFSFTWGRLWLDILPGVLALVGGLLLVGGANRGNLGLGSWLGIVAGAWFVIGPSVSTLWNHGMPDHGGPIGSGTGLHFVEQIGFFYALGALILYFAATTLGRISVRGVRDAERAGEAAGAEGAHRRTGRDEGTGRQAAPATAPRREAAREPAPARGPEGEGTGGGGIRGGAPRGGGADDPDAGGGARRMG